MRDNRLSFSDIPKEITITQVCGSIIFLFLGLHEFWFINLWIGAAIATPIGLIVCVITDKSFIKTRIFFLGVAACIGFLFIVPFIIIHDEAIDDFRSLKATSISEIIISGVGEFLNLLTH